MKKALLVLGFALCATFAFAQTNKLTLPKADCGTVTVNGPEAKPIDYKASIFMKDDTVLARFNFASGNMDGIIYGANGQVGPNEIMWKYASDGTLTVPDTLTAHGQNASYSNWQRINDTGAVRSNYSILNNTWMINYIPRYMGPEYTGDNNGFMLMTLRATYGSGAHNAYFKLPAVDPAGSAVIDVAFNQLYRKYYDYCYIDYKIGTKWVAREINVTGVDLSVNDFGSLSAVFTMPIPLASEDSIVLRFRYYSPGRTGIASYGYVWAVDNVTVIGGEADRWYTNGQVFVDGAYGTMPQGMSIPLSWYGNFYNNGSNDRTGIQLNVEHFGEDRTSSDIVITKNIANAPSAPTARRVAIVDERGFMPYVNDLDSLDFMSGWWWFNTTYQAENITGFPLRGMPTTTLGTNYITANLTSPGANAAEWDTIAYNVVEETGGEGGLAIDGLRWGHDNGIIPAGSIYSYGYVYEEPNWFITEDGNYDHEGYMVWLRYTTGNDVPEGWVFRGLEIIPNTVNDIDDIVGTDITPMAYIGVPADDGSSMNFSSVETGFSANVPHTVAESEVNILNTGYINTNDPTQSYNAVNMRFFAQPEVLPNTSYYFGYRMASNGKFSAASNAYSYATAGDSYQSYYSDADLHNYYDQFEPGYYDLYVYDPDKADDIWAGVYHPYFPMIRPILGAPATIPTFEISAECGDGVVIESEAGDEICNGTMTTYEGGGASVYIIPEGTFNAEFWSSPDADTATGCYHIDKIFVDGNEIDIDDAPAGIDVQEANYIVYNDDSTRILERRFYYAVSFASIAGNHVVRATAYWDVFHPENIEGIDPVAVNVSLGLQPNPATSSVKLNVQGVNGTVECSIIDMSGRVVYNANINAGEPTTIDLTGIAAGAYFVRVVSDKTSKVEKLIVR